MRIGNEKDKSEMDRAAMAAILESYATAWTALLLNLELQKGQKLLVPAATSALLSISLCLRLVLRYGRRHVENLRGRSY